MGDKTKRILIGLFFLLFMAVSLEVIRASENHSGFSFSGVLGEIAIMFVIGAFWAVVRGG